MKNSDLKSKFLFISILFFGFFAITENSLAAEHYVRADADGMNDGSNWTDAWNNLPTALTRGDTYYIADGVYPGYIFNDVESSDSYIIIKKATVSEHGTEIGWNDNYGDGQVIFTELTSNDLYPIIQFETGYYIWDGVTGSENIEASYGFKIVYVNTGRRNYLMGAPRIGVEKQVDHLQVLHTAFILPTVAEGYANTAFYAASRDGVGGHDLIFSNNYVLGGSNHLDIRRLNNGFNLSNTVIENNYFDTNWTHTLAHGGVIVSNLGCYDVTVKNNIFNNPAIYAVDFHHNAAAPETPGNSGWNIYNNIVIGGDNPVTFIFGDADTSYNDTVVRSNFHHNTTINVDPSGGFVAVGNLTDPANQKSYVYNNLFYNEHDPKMDNSGFTSGVIIHSHNAHYNSTGTYDADEGGTAIDVTGDPFVDSAGGDYRLVAGTNAIDVGLSLAAPFNIDRDGITRPQGAGWDIGAFEYQALYRADVDGSSQITTTDALLTLRNSLGLSMTGTAWQASSTTGDVNCDGSSNSTDALLILRQSLGLSMNETGWCG